MAVRPFRYRLVTQLEHQLIILLGSLQTWTLVTGQYLNQPDGRTQGKTVELVS